MLNEALVEETCKQGIHVASTELEALLPDSIDLGHCALTQAQTQTEGHEP